MFFILNLVKILLEKNIVILPQNEFEIVLEELEELEDIKLYDEAKKDNDGEGMRLKDYIESRSA